MIIEFASSSKLNIPQDPVTIKQPGSSLSQVAFAHLFSVKEASS